MSDSQPSTKAMRQQVEDYVVSLQDQIVGAFEKLDPSTAAFKRDSWTRTQGGRGQSCVFPPVHSDASARSSSSVLEKAGVNISIIHGMLPPAAIKQMRADHSSIAYDPDSNKSLPFFAGGISMVIHPRNPSAPTMHANVRYFEITDPETSDVLAWWFGGGTDLTPSYLYEEDAIHFHQTLKDACEPHGKELYPSFKKWCDEYFHIPHRQESRGVGGIFFDDLSPEPHKRIVDNDALRPRTADEIFAFVRSIGDSIVPAYLPILERRVNTPSTEEMRRWQLIRRGRYVEFNLVVDRGTKFGLMTPGARIESILMSLPETARWEYMSAMGEDPESEEGKLLAVLKTPKEWV